MKAKFRKYLAYAIGEILLVVFGILIALQIDNWNTERIENATMISYLESIARNVQADVAEVEGLYAQRVDTLLDVIRTQTSITGRRTFNVDMVTLFHTSLQEASAAMIFTADVSGYDALKNSGVLDRLQGRDIERVLSEYYDTTAQIAHLEQGFNARLQEFALRFLLERRQNTSLPPYVFRIPSAMSPEAFEAAQPAIEAVINSALSRIIMEQYFNAVQILRQYQRLIDLGNLYTDMVSSGATEFDDQSNARMMAVFDPKSRAAGPIVIADGRIAAHNYMLQIVEADYSRVLGVDIVVPGEESLGVNYPGGAAWASVFFLTILTSETGRPYLDFSAYDRLELDLKHVSGGDVINVMVKDFDDPDDESPPTVALAISDEWQTYSIDLSDFDAVDFARLHSVLGFVFQREPQSFLLRNARFVSSR
jgi:hypothetical protein